MITYLDAEGNPVKRSDGYATIVRTQVGGRAYDDFYYDLNGQQVQCAGGYYGLHREFNTEGQNISLTFLDKSGHAVCKNELCSIFLRWEVFERAICESWGHQ